MCFQNVPIDISFSRSLCFGTRPSRFTNWSNTAHFLSFFETFTISCLRIAFDCKRCLRGNGGRLSSFNSRNLRITESWAFIVFVANECDISETNRRMCTFLTGSLVLICSFRINCMISVFKWSSELLRGFFRLPEYCCKLSFSSHLRIVHGWTDISNAASAWLYPFLPG